MEWIEQFIGSDDRAIFFQIIASKNVALSQDLEENTDIVIRALIPSMLERLLRTKDLKEVLNFFKEEEEKTSIEKEWLLGSSNHPHCSK